MALAEIDLCNMALGQLGVTRTITSSDGTIANNNDSTKEGKQCKRFYATVRDVVLSVAPWPFASKRATLTPYGASAYVAATTYAKGDSVNYNNGQIFLSLQAGNTGHTPTDAASSTWWARIDIDDYANVYQVPSDLLEAQFLYPLKERIPFKRLANPLADGATYPATVICTDNGDPTNTSTSPCILEYTISVTNPAIFAPLFVEAMMWALAERLVMPLAIAPTEVARAHQMAEAAVNKAWAFAERQQQEDHDESDYVNVRGGGVWNNPWARWPYAQGRLK